MSLTPEGALARSLFVETTDAQEAARFEPRRIGVAISGGSDSMALLHLVAAWAREQAYELRAVTVDHRLRPEAAEEAAFVARTCLGLGVEHDVLRWTWSGRGNLQEQARIGRRSLIEDWARELRLHLVCLGHTADDQAETVLLRLARGSGVDGLAAMPDLFVTSDFLWRRPLLPISRAELRDWLRARGLSWVEDPSNEDLRFDRARARAMMARLADLGLTRERLVRTAEHMARARAGLDAQAAEIARTQVREEEGALLLPLNLLHRFASDDAPGRLLAAALMWVGGRQVRPRWQALERLAALARAGRTATLHGCRIAIEGGWLRVTREARGRVPPSGRPGFARFVARSELSRP